MTLTDIVAEYSRHPPNKGKISEPTIVYREMNRLCADVCEVSLHIEWGKILDFSFDGYMSIIATACTSVFGESIVWKDMREVLSFDESYMLTLLWSGVTQRRRNAMVFWLLATKNALETYLGSDKRYDFSDILRDDGIYIDT